MWCHHNWCLGKLAHSSDSLVKWDRRSGRANKGWVVTGSACAHQGDAQGSDSVSIFAGVLLVLIVTHCDHDFLMSWVN